MYNSIRVFSILEKKLSAHEPYALVRIGDGEGYFLSMDSDKIRYVCERQFGKFTPKWIIIRDNLIQACCQADIIGIPTERHLKKNPGWNIVKDYVYDFNNQFCSIDVHVDMLVNGWLDELLYEQDEIYYISGRDLDFSKYGIKKVNKFIITPEIKFESNKNQVPHFPNQYYQVKEWISNLDCSGKLCLVGAGVAGKIYNIWFKRRGGISIDLGCVFDIWAGKKTRGKNRGVDVTDNIYKL
jgi:hypothetical protein